MPIGFDSQAKQKMDAIASAAEEYEYSVVFPEYDNLSPTFNLRSTTQKFKNSVFVLADLSFERPSCYYELGIVETLQLPIYLIAQTGTNIHQTIHRADVQYYSDLAELQMIVEGVISKHRTYQFAAPKCY